MCTEMKSITDTPKRDSNRIDDGEDIDDTQEQRKICRPSKYNRNFALGGRNSLNPYLCCVCYCSYSSQSVLNWHMKKAHSLEAWEEPSEENVCSLCNTTVYEGMHFIQHLKDVHNIEEDAEEDYVYDPFEEEEKVSKKYPCSECPRSYSTQAVLTRHMVKAHALQKPDGKSMCSLCDTPVRMGPNFSRHLKEVHNVEEDIEELTFNSLEDFHTWKEGLTRLTHTNYARVRGVKLVTGGERLYFHCHRSGKFTSRGKNLRNSKPSVKMSRACPSRIIVTKLANEVEVKFFKNHVGHETSLKYLTLTQNEREDIAEHLAATTPMQSVLHDLKRNHVSTSKIEALTRRDLYNMLREFKTGYDVLCKKDAHGIISGRDSTEELLDSDEEVTGNSKEEDMIAQPTSTRADDMTAQSSANTQVEGVTEQATRSTEVADSINDFNGFDNTSRFETILNMATNIVSQAEESELLNMIEATERFLDFIRKAVKSKKSSEYSQNADVLMSDKHDQCIIPSTSTNVEQNVLPKQTDSLAFSESSSFHVISDNAVDSEEETFVIHRGFDHTY